MSKANGASTPLSQSAASTLANQVFTSENASKATTFATDSAKELRQMANDGDFSVRLFALLGGIALLVNSSLGFVGKILSLKFVGAIIEFYVFVMGIAIIILENKKIPMPRSFEHNLFKYCLFLKYIWGRGILYFVVGTLDISTGGIISLAIGSFMCFVGIMYVYVGRQASRKLAEIRTNKFSEGTLRAEFNEADTNRSGTINIDQFKMVTKNLNMDLNRRELEAAFLQIDVDDKGSVDFKQFLVWWKGYDDESPVFEAQIV